MSSQKPAAVVDEPQVSAPPQVRDRDGRVWTRVSDGQWRHVVESDPARDEPGAEYNVGWGMLRDLLGPLTAVSGPLDGS